MKNQERNIEDVLRMKGFKKVEQNISEYFGNHYIIYSNNIFDLRLVSDKSIESIDIKSIDINEFWYDLSLVRALLHHEKVLNMITTFEEFELFLQKDIESVIRLFDKANYSDTKKELEDLQNKRAKQMFLK